MKTGIIIRSLILSVLFFNLLLAACKGTSQKTIETKKSTLSSDMYTASGKNIKVTFIELGSVKCIPCREMQKVIASVQQKYGSQVQTIFYDVWTKEGKPYADIYNINLIPVQVFLDESGKEFYRHEGYFPEEELVAVLKSKGVTD